MRHWLATPTKTCPHASLNTPSPCEVWDAFGGHPLNSQPLCTCHKGPAPTPLPEVEVAPAKGQCVVTGRVPTFVVGLIPSKPVTGFTVAQAKLGVLSEVIVWGWGERLAWAQGQGTLHPHLDPGMRVIWAGSNLLISIWSVDSPPPSTWKDPALPGIGCTLIMALN